MVLHFGEPLSNGAVELVQIHNRLGAAIWIRAGRRDPKSPNWFTPRNKNVEGNRTKRNQAKILLGGLNMNMENILPWISKITIPKWAVEMFGSCRLGWLSENKAHLAAFCLVDFALNTWHFSLPSVKSDNLRSLNTNLESLECLCACWSTYFSVFLNVYSIEDLDHLLRVLRWFALSLLMFLFIMSVKHMSFQFLLQNIYIIDSCFRMYSKPSITNEFNHSSRLVWVKDGPVVCKTCQGSNVKYLGSWSENPVNDGGRGHLVGSILEMFGGRYVPCMSGHLLQFNLWLCCTRFILI